jgi:hypothetical protein
MRSTGDWQPRHALLPPTGRLAQCVGAWAVCMMLGRSGCSEAGTSTSASRYKAIYLTALPGQLELDASSGRVPVNAAAAIGSPRSW